MTISTTTIKNSYSGNNSNLNFTYTFKITDADDIEVIIRDAAGNESVKTLTTNYAVTGVGNAGGGQVQFVSGQAPLSSETIVIRRSTPQTQGMDLIENDPLPAETLENAHDKIISIAQELQEQVDRSIKLSRTNTINSTEFRVDATARANKILTFDSNGELTVEQELGSNRGNWSSGVAYAERDIVKDTSNNNVYYCLVAHTSQSTFNADIAKWSLLVDAAAATAAISTAQAAAATAAADAATSTTNANTASTQAGIATAAASAAASSEANSLSHSQNSQSSATAAANSASAASTSETNAAASAASAAASAGGGAVKASTNDTTPGFLNDKFDVGLGLKKEITNAGANEKFVISSNALVLAIALGG